MSKKKMIIGISILVLVIAVIMSVVFLTRNKESETKEIRENVYTMYVKINPLVKIEFKESYYVCIENKVEKECSDKTNKVENYTLLNDDAKEIYEGVDLKGLSVAEALAKVYDRAREKKLNFEEVEITSNYEFSESDLISKVKEKSQYKDSFKVKVNFEDNLKEEEIIKNSEEKVTYYTVKFNSKGGNKLESIQVKKGESFTKPKNPTRSGYEFVEWQLNNKKYDFDTKVSKSITLTAKWKKKSSTTNTTISSSNNNSNTSSNQTSSSSTSTSTNENKINLNDKIRVTLHTESTGEINCFFYMFASNLKTIFPKANIKKYDFWSTVPYWPGPAADAQDEEISEELLKKNISAIKFNTGSENNIVSIFKKYKSGKQAGINSVKYTLNNHRLTFEYKFLTFSDNKYESLGKELDTQVKNLLKSATIFSGPCGGFDFEETVTLTEKICNDYNLNCGKW